MSDIIYLKLCGEQQGDISAGCGAQASIGNRFQLGHENEIFAFSLSNGITSTSKGANFQALNFCKLIDKSSPLLTTAITNNEKLQLEFNLYRISRYGMWEKYFYIELRGASISAINVSISNNNFDTEVITVRYDYIRCKHLTANTEFSYLELPADYKSLFNHTAQTEKPLQTINSKAAGQLLAAGGIYNGNIEGFGKAAEQLGGDAPAGYKQVMDNKGLIVAGASLAAILTMGKMKFPELGGPGEFEGLERFGARGTYTGREFDPALAGRPIENLSTEGAIIDQAGIADVEKHLSRFAADPANDVMVDRLKRIERGEIPPEQVDLNYYTHECREFERYCNLGWETGEPEGVEGYKLWNHAHTATLEDFKLKGELEDLYHPEALE